MCSAPEEKSTGAGQFPYPRTALEYCSIEFLGWEGRDWMQHQRCHALLGN
jgi:hypothetical protein